MELDGIYSNGDPMSYSPIYFGPQARGPSIATITNYTNQSPSAAIPQAQAVSTNLAGLIIPLDVSDPSNYNNFVGYANVRIPANATGEVISNGRLLNFTTILPVGTPLWVDTNGNPTNIVPSIGVNSFESGDAIIFLGVLVANEVSGVDIALFTQVTGIL